MDIAGAQTAFDRLGLLTRVDLRLKPGVDVAAFRDRLQAQLPRRSRRGADAGQRWPAPRACRAPIASTWTSLPWWRCLPAACSSSPRRCCRWCGGAPYFALLRVLGMTRRQARRACSSPKGAARHRRQQPGHPGRMATRLRGAAPRRAGLGLRILSAALPPTLTLFPVALRCASRSASRWRCSGGRFPRSRLRARRRRRRCARATKSAPSRAAAGRAGTRACSPPPRSPRSPRP